METFRHYVAPWLLILVLCASTQCYGVFRVRWRAGHKIWASTVALSLAGLWVNFAAVIYLLNAR